MLQRIEDVAPTLAQTFTVMIYQYTLGIWNKTTIDNLIACLSDDEIPTTSKTVAHTLLKNLASSHPKLFKDFISTLAQWITSQSKEISQDRSREDKLVVEDILKCLSRLGELDLPGSEGKAFVGALKEFALNGETERQGRAATTILLKLKMGNVYAEDLVAVHLISLLC